MVDDQIPIRPISVSIGSGERGVTDPGAAAAELGSCDTGTFASAGIGALTDALAQNALRSEASFTPDS
jgi:hypothetical protein